MKVTSFTYFIILENIADGSVEKMHLLCRNFLISKNQIILPPSQLSWKFIIRSNALFKSFDYKFDSRNGNFLFICFMLFPLYKLHCIFEDYLFDNNSFHISGLQK